LCVHSGQCPHISLYENVPAGNRWMVIVFIILDWIFVINTTTDNHDSLQRHLIEGKAIFNLVYRNV